MNDDQLNELLKKARSEPPDTSRAEYAFETRLMANIRALRQKELPWFAVALRLVPAFAMVVIFLGAATLTVAPTVYPSDWSAAVTGSLEEWVLFNYVLS